MSVIDARPRNPGIDWDTHAVAVVDSLRSWPRFEGQPRRAGVSAFGLSGTNAHAILEAFRRTTHAHEGKQG